MAEQHTVRVVVEGDTASLTTALARAGGESAKFRDTVAKTGTRLKDMESAAKKSGTGLDAHAGKMSKATGIALGLEKALDSTKGGTLSMAKAALSAAAAFGPWGIAIGAVGTALVGLVSGQLEAAKAAREHNIALLEQRKLMFQAEIVEDKRRLAEKQERREKDQLRRQATDPRLIGAENAVATSGGSSAALARLAEVKAAHAEARGELDTAREIRREEELRLLNAKDVTVAKKAQAKASSEASQGSTAFMFGGFSGNVAGESQSRAFKAELAAAKQRMPRAGSDTRDAVAAQAVADERLRAIEIERATTGESIELIEREKNARLELIDVQIQASKPGAERAQLAGEQEQVEHDAAIARIGARQASEEKLMARRVALAQMAVGLANSGAQLANMVAKASGASAKKQEAIANRTAGVQAMAIGALEVVEAVAAAASFNVPQAVLHGAAAVVAFAQGGMLLALAGGGGGAASAGGGAVGGGSLGAAPSGGSTPTPGSDSAIPGSPGPQSPKSGSSGSSNGGKSTVINIGEVHTYGTPRREFLSSVAEGLDVDHASQRRRTA